MSDRQACSLLRFGGIAVFVLFPDIGPIGHTDERQKSRNARHRHLFLHALVSHAMSLVGHPLWDKQGFRRKLRSLGPGAKSLKFPSLGEMIAVQIPYINDLDPTDVCTPQCQQT